MYSFPLSNVNIPVFFCVCRLNRGNDTLDRFSVIFLGRQRFFVTSFRLSSWLLAKGHKNILISPKSVYIPLTASDNNHNTGYWGKFWGFFFSLFVTLAYKHMLRLPVLIEVIMYFFITRHLFRRTSAHKWKNALLDIFPPLETTDRTSLTPCLVSDKDTCPPEHVLKMGICTHLLAMSFQQRYLLSTPISNVSYRVRDGICLLRIDS